MKKSKQQISYEYDWLKSRRGRTALIALLVLAFPVGLYVMWQHSSWRKEVKIGVSALWGLILVLALVIGLITSLDYNYGNVSYTGSTGNKRMLAPLPPDNQPDTGQYLRSASETSSLISVPTPTPVPTMVYCNDNGVNYHLQGCRYVYSTTPRVTLTQALNAGKTACKLCNPPKEETYGNNK